MLLKVFLTLLCVFHSCVHTLTSSDFKRSISYELPLLRQDFTPYRDGRDRRTTHWETKSHSNLDDDSTNDRDRGQGQISYSSLLEEPSILGLSKRFETSEKSPKNFDATGNIVEDPNSSANLCVDWILPSRSIASWLSFAKAQLNRENFKNLPFASIDNDKFAASRCREKIDSWSMQEPVYVEEPRVIVIEINDQNLRRQSINQQDPFYVARGKRPLFHSFVVKKLKNQNNEKSKNFPVTKIDLSQSVRKKRDNYGENLEKYPIDGISTGSHSTFTDLIEKNPETRYLQRRGKHSDILDILNEPFFMSRGKKNSLAIRGAEMNNRYSKELVNFETRRQIFDTWLASEATKNCDWNSPECALFRIRSIRTSRIDGTPTGNPLGDVRDILKENDPFYVARGKKSDSSTIGEFNEI